MAAEDSICTQGVRTTAGSKMLEKFIPPYDATVMKKLSLKGTPLLGKLNMDEFGVGGYDKDCHFKNTKNPWQSAERSKSPCKGTAASVASGMAGFALGADMDGSLRQSAADCGVVGLKPTYGLVSRFGLISTAPSFEQIGVVTCDVTDCALVLNAISGYDTLDSTSANMEHPDYTSFLQGDIKGLKIGIAREYIEGEAISHSAKKAILNAIETLTALGAKCEEFSFSMAQYSAIAHYIIATSEIGSSLARYDGVKYGYRALDCLDISQLYFKTRMEGFGLGVKERIILGTYILSEKHHDVYYKKSLKVRTLIQKKFDDIFKKYDLILGLTVPNILSKKDGMKSRFSKIPYQNMHTVSANLAGLPAISLPCGFDNNKSPVGLHLIGRHFDEGTLLRTGFAFEQNTDFHKKRPKLEWVDKNAL